MQQIRHPDLMADGWSRSTCFKAKTRSQSEDFARAELTAAQRCEDSLQRQYDGQLRSHVHTLQDEYRDLVGQEEDKLCKEF